MVNFVKWCGVQDGQLITKLTEKYNLGNNYVYNNGTYFKLSKIVP